jgi:hypothetical protein
MRLVALRLYAEDVDDAKAIYVALGYNKVLRELFASHMKRVRLMRRKEIQEDGRLDDLDLEGIDPPSRFGDEGGA